MTTEEILLNDAKAIYIGNLNTVDADLELPCKGEYGSDITWKSSHPNLISEAGQVTRPRAGTGDREVILTALIQNGEDSLERSYKVTVLAKKPDWTAVYLIPMQIQTIQGQTDDIVLPGTVITKKNTGGCTALPVSWDPPCVKNVPGIYQVAYKPLAWTQPNLPTEVTVHIINSQDQDSAVSLTALLPASLPTSLTASRSQSNSPAPRLLQFTPDKVSIDGGIFAENKDRMLKYLLTVNDDSMLYNFRKAASLDTKGAKPLTGWDAPECLLKGHTTGHYLSALALAACCEGNESIYQKKLCYMVHELAECQNAMESSGNFQEGFLSGYSEEQFDSLEQYMTYPSIWAPYYTLHKIMAGLLDSYEYSGIKTALEIVEKIGMWVYKRLSACSDEQRRRMWSMYIAGEYGGMNEVMARLYRFSLKPEYILAARFFDNDLLIYPMSQKIDTLPGIHANQHIPQIVGLLELYSQTAESKYYTTAYNFWEIVTKSHTFSIGGIGEGELFQDADIVTKFLTDKTAESCASYNMLKLTSRLFGYTAASQMVDYYERTLYNHIVATHDQSGPTGGSTYFMPLKPGGKKEFDTDGNTCCHGTGLENHLKYNEMIYHRDISQNDHDILYINLFIPSTLDWTEKGIKIRQSDGYLEHGSVKINIEGTARFELRLRIPGWLEGKPNLFINGEEAVYTRQEGYAVIKREFCDSDAIVWSTPFIFRFEPSPDDPSIGSIACGPLLMMAESDGPGLLPIGGIVPEKTQHPLIFSCGEYTLKPNYMLWDNPYHAYVCNPI